jgi:Xaa-Pro aminopeptidase
MVKAFPKTVFQSFDSTSDRKTVAPRVKALRTELVAAGLDAFLIPRADAHRNEAVPASEARLAYISAFTGSAGLAIVGAKRAGLFVDSRYTLQAPAQTDTKVFAVFETPPASPATEIGRFVPAAGRIGYDPWLHTPGEIAELFARLGGRATLVATENLVDRIWPDRPAPPATPIEFLGDNRAGRSAASKLEELRVNLVAEHADAVVLTLPESICWLFNMRGRDTPNTPFVLGFAIVPKTGQPTLFLGKSRIDAAIVAALAGTAKLAPTSALVPALQRLGSAHRQVLVDPASVPAAVANALVGAGARLIEKRDPVLLPKARKNDAEIGGMREAHRVDGVALAKFLCWFDAEAPQGELTEIGIVTALEAFRREDPSVVDVSFDTISGSGPNGAIVHYRVTDETDRRLNPGELMLVDSGAQYLLGTTDITRTLYTGSASAEEKDRYTRVLKGMMGIAMARFPRGTSGAQLDILARQHLWQAGVSYNHGTGHGVGAFLSVHEGPMGISSRYATPLEPGMIISDEPGYYKAGAYGIRIENLVMVVPSAVGDGKYLEFETLTLAPIETRLIDMTLLIPAEQNWLNLYHQRVWKELGPLVQGEVKAWLKRATQEI